MKLPDVNLFLYAYDSRSPRHGRLDQPCVTVVNATERRAAVLRELLDPLGAAGNLTTDAHLAALAIEHGD